MARSSFAAWARSPRSMSLWAALPGSSSTRRGGTAGCCWQQRLLKDDGLNSIVVAEVVLLRSYRSGKHTWKRFKQIQTQKAEQNTRSETTPIRKSPAMPCLLINTEPTVMSFARKSYRGGMACLPARLAKDIGKTEGVVLGYHWKLLIRVVIYTTNDLLGTAVVWTHLSFGTVMTQAKPLWNCMRYSHVLTGTLS